MSDPTYRVKNVYVNEGCGSYDVIAETFTGDDMLLAYFDKTREGKKAAKEYAKKVELSLRGK